MSKFRSKTRRERKKLRSRILREGRQVLPERFGLRITLGASGDARCDLEVEKGCPPLQSAAVAELALLATGIAIATVGDHIDKAIRDGSAPQEWAELGEEWDRLMCVAEALTAVLLGLGEAMDLDCNTADPREVN